MGRARYERRSDGPPGKRNGFRPRHVQTGEGELRIEIPQVRETAEPFVSKLFRKGHTKRLLQTDPLKAMIVGAFVRGLSMRDVESLCEEAGLGRTSKSTVARICSELHERFEAFCRRDLSPGQNPGLRASVKAGLAQWSSTGLPVNGERGTLTDSDRAVRPRSEVRGGRASRVVC